MEGGIRIFPPSTLSFEVLRMGSKVEPPICCSPTNYNSWFLKGEYLEGGFFASKFQLVRELSPRSRSAREFPNRSRAVHQDSPPLAGKNPIPARTRENHEKTSPIVF